jgi:hypothetical protein
MVGAAGDCDQLETVSAGGAVAEVSASGGYMLAQCALPWAAPGKLRGLTLQRLFKRVLAAGAPDLFMSSFNEHIGPTPRSRSHCPSTNPSTTHPPAHTLDTTPYVQADGRRPPRPRAPPSTWGCRTTRRGCKCGWTRA